MSLDGNGRGDGPVGGLFEKGQGSPKVKPKSSPDRRQSPRGVGPGQGQYQGHVQSRSQGEASASDREARPTRACKVKNTVTVDQAQEDSARRSITRARKRSVRVRTSDRIRNKQEREERTVRAATAASKQKLKQVENLDIPIEYGNPFHQALFLNCLDLHPVSWNNETLLKFQRVHFVPSSLQKHKRRRLAHSHLNAVKNSGKATNNPCVVDLTCSDDEDHSLDLELVINPPGDIENSSIDHYGFGSGLSKMNVDCRINMEQNTIQRKRNNFSTMTQKFPEQVPTPDHIKIVKIESILQGEGQGSNQSKGQVWNSNSNGSLTGKKPLLSSSSMKLVQKSSYPHVNRNGNVQSHRPISDKDRNKVQKQNSEYFNLAPKSEPKMWTVEVSDTDTDAESRFRSMKSSPSSGSGINGSTTTNGINSFINGKNNTNSSGQNIRVGGTLSQKIRQLHVQQNGSSLSKIPTKSASNLLLTNSRPLSLRTPLPTLSKSKLPSLSNSTQSRLIPLSSKSPSVSLLRGKQGIPPNTKSKPSLNHIPIPSSSTYRIHNLGQSQNPKQYPSRTKVAFPNTNVSSASCLPVPSVRVATSTSFPKLTQILKYEKPSSVSAKGLPSLLSSIPIANLKSNGNSNPSRSTNHSGGNSKSSSSSFQFVDLAAEEEVAEVEFQFEEIRKRLLAVDTDLAMIN